jgi:hypothetical protein
MADYDPLRLDGDAMDLDPAGNEGRDGYDGLFDELIAMPNGDHVPNARQEVLRPESVRGAGVGQCSAPNEVVPFDSVRKNLLRHTSTTANTTKRHRPPKVVL